MHLDMSIHTIKVDITVDKRETVDQGLQSFSAAGHIKARRAKRTKKSIYLKCGE